MGSYLSGLIARAANLRNGTSGTPPEARKKKLSGDVHRAARGRARAIQFETMEPRILLSADVINGVTRTEYLNNNDPLIGLGQGAVFAEIGSAFGLYDDVASAAQGDTAYGDALDHTIPGLLERDNLPGGGAILFAKDFWAPTLGDVLGIDADEDNVVDANDLATIRNEVVSAVSDLIDGFVNSMPGAGFTASDLADAIDGLDGTSSNGKIHVAFNLLDADDDADNGIQKFVLTNTGGDNYEFLYNIEVVVTVTEADGKDAFSLDPGRNADALELDYLADAPGSAHLPDVPLNSQYRIKSQLGLNATITEAMVDDDNDVDTPDIVQTTVNTTGFFLRDPVFSAGAATAGEDPIPIADIAALQFGMLDVRSDNGTAQFDMNVGVALADDQDGNADGVANFTSAGQISAAARTVTTGGAIDVQLPIEVFDDQHGIDLLGDAFGLETPVVKLYTNDPFAPVHAVVPNSDDGRTAISIDLVDFENLNPFRNIDVDGLANVFAGLETMLKQLQSKAQAFGLTLPLIDSTKVSDLLGFDGPMKTLYEKLTQEVNGARVAAFDTVQDFVNLLKDGLNQILDEFDNTLTDLTVTDINPRYVNPTGNAPTLLFTIELHKSATDTLDIDSDLGLPLDPLGQISLESAGVSLDATFDVELTLGIELVEEPDIAIVSELAPSALVGGVIANNVNVSEALLFSLILGGKGTAKGELAAGNYATPEDLRDALQAAIDDAIEASFAIPSDRPDVVVALNAQDRLVISCEELPYLQLADRDSDGGSAFAALGFLDGQRASTSRLPVNGQLSGDAVFELTIGGVTKTITVTQASTGGNASVADLVADLNTAIVAQFGAGTWATLVGDAVVGQQIRIAAGSQFLRIDNTDAVSRAELGLLDNALDSRLTIRGDSQLSIGPNSQPDALPDGNPPGNPPTNGMVTFTVALEQDGVSSGPISITVDLRSIALNPDGGIDYTVTPTNTAARIAFETAARINEALQNQTLIGDQKLGSVLVATAVEFQQQQPDGKWQPTGKWGIRLSQPAAALDTGLDFAFADNIAIAGIDADENLGLANNSSADRVGARLNDTLAADATFTINLTVGAGVIRQQTITLSKAALDGANQNHLQGVVDAINAAIAASSYDEIKNGVVVGLEGSRLVFAVRDAAYKVIELSSVNQAAVDDLGLQEGISARIFEGVQAFVQDLHLGATLALEGQAHGEANFGFVTLDLGDATAELDAGVQVDFGNASADDVNDGVDTGKIYLKDIFKSFSKAFASPGGLLDVLDTGNDGTLISLGGSEGDQEIDIGGSASLHWDGATISVAGSGGVADDLADELGEIVSPYVHIDFSDITDLSTLTVDAELGSLEDFADFGFDDAIAALRAIAQWLTSYIGQLDIVNEEIPVLGVSLADALGFVDDFAQAVEDIAENPTASLQELLDKVNEGLQQFVGSQAFVGYDANSPGVLTFNLPFKRQFSDILPLEIDLEELLADNGIDVPDFIADNSELSGSANLAAAFAIDASIAFGIDVAELSSVLDLASYSINDVRDAIFLIVEDDGDSDSTDYTHLDLTAYAAADNVTFTGALGPFGLFITNGGAVLNSDGVFGNDDPASIGISIPDVGTNDGRVTLKDLFDASNLDQIFNTDNIDVDLGVAAVLPVFFPTSSSSIGNLDFTASITDPFGDDPVSYALNSLPDFSQLDLSDLGLLDTINLFLAGADTVLGTLGDLITGKVFGAEDVSSLPLVGDALADAGAFIDQIRDEVIPRITNAIETAGELAASIFKDVGDILQDALNTLGFLGSSIKLDFLNGSGGILQTFDFAGAIDLAALANMVQAADGFSFVIDLDVDLAIETPDLDLNLEVFQLEVKDPVAVNIHAGLTFGIGVSLSDGFFFQVDADDPELEASITVDLPTDIQAQLFLLGLTIHNNNTGPDEHELAAAFSVDVMGTDANGRLGFADIGNMGFDVDFGAEAALDLELELGIDIGDAGSINLPTIKADFAFAWGFGDITVGGQQIGVDDDHPDTPLLSIGNLRLDMESFLGDTIGPFIESLYEILEPIDPILDILTDPIPVLSDIMGPTSLLDVAATFGFANPALVQALEILDQITDLAGSLGTQGEIVLFEGDFTFGGGDMDLTDMGQVGALLDPEQALGQVLDGLTDIGLELPDGVGDVLGWLASGFQPSAGNELPGGLTNPAGGFSFPFLDNFEEVLGLFFGRNATLIAFDLPPLEFGFDFSIYVPIWDGLGARFSGGINAVIDLAFGYDTEGLFRFINGGLNPLDLVQGFFVYDDNPFAGFAGIDVPELEITGQITAAAELNLVVASAGVGGGIFATLGFDLADPDGDFRVRLDEIIANLVNGFDQGVGPLGLFDVDALIEARLFAYIEALFGLWRKEFQFGPSVPLYEEHYSVPHDPVLATDMDNGTLRLNMGDFAADRIYTMPNGSNDPVDGDEQFEIIIDSANQIRVRGSGPDFDLDGDGDWQTFTNDDGWDLISGFAGIGNDRITVTDNSGGAVKVNFTGGAGNDTLQGGGGHDTLTGETGEDELVGGAGDDSMDGGAGADCLEGEAGADTLLGGASNDVLVGGTGADLILGADGDDIATGGDGDDIIFGDAGVDLIAGGGDDDILMGGEGNDRVWGDFDLTITDCVLVLTADFDEPALVAGAVQGADTIGGGAGSDEVQGNGGNDIIRGDSTYRIAEDYTLVPVEGGTDPQWFLPDFGSFGADNLSGGAGNDLIDGEAGNDLIRGDNTRVDNEDDDNPFTWSEGDRFSRGTDDGDADGNDTLLGGRDSDIIYGNGGNDTIAGGTENDILSGNAGDDRITGDVGADVVFGDSGIIQVFVAGDAVDGGVYAAPTQDFKLLESNSEAGDGDDWIDAGQDNDIVFGGGGNGLQASDPAVGQTIEDLIRSGSGDDVAFGDHGKLSFTYTLGAGASFATLLESVDQAFGGDDQILGSTGRDVLVGGFGGDFVYGDDGLNLLDPDSRDVVAGDHIQMTQLVLKVKDNAGPVADLYTAAPSQIRSTEVDPGYGGDDVLDGRQDDDFLIGGPGDDTGIGGLGNDVLLGDRGQIDFDTSFIVAGPGYEFGKGELFVLKTVKSIDLALADIPYTGSDLLSGGDGNDVVIGGGQGDTLYGDAEIDGTVGTLSADSDILIGDNGQVDYLQHGGLARVFTTDTLNATGGNDTIEGNSGVDIAAGGVGADRIWGDAGTQGATDGDDILLGDSGTVDFAADRDLQLALTGGTPDLTTLDLIESSDDGLGDSDTIRGDAGSDVAMGGMAGDVIFGDNATASAANADGGDILLGDNGYLWLVDPALDANAADGTDLRIIRGGAVALLRSTDEDDGTTPSGGEDTVSGNAGGDIILGGVRGDTLYGDRSVVAGSNLRDGNDIMLGDNGALEWLSTGRFGDLPASLDLAAENADLANGFDSRDANLDTLDLVTTEQPNNGGRDLIYGDNGSDVIFGGTDSDLAFGDSGDDGTDSGAARDLMLGDHGRLYPQFSRALLGQDLVVLNGINGRNFFAIDIEAGDGGEGDILFGEEGADILMGQQGDDRLFGGAGDDDMTGGHNVAGGADELGGSALVQLTGQWDILLEGVDLQRGGAWNDLMDGGTGNDAMAGDNATIWRRADLLNPRFRALDGSLLYTTTYDTVQVNVQGADAPTDSTNWKPELGANAGRDIKLLDHDEDVEDDPQYRFGNDIMAGGAGNDALFGQLGDDLMQGDGSLGSPADASKGLFTFGGGVWPAQASVFNFNVPENTSTDGSDYLEGNGGNDIMYGGLGQDDMIGGSSNLFGLLAAAQRPDGADIMFGGAGSDARLARNAGDNGTESGADGLNRAADADAMLGDNGVLYRIVNAAGTAYLRFAYDSVAYSSGIVVRGQQWLDYTLGGPDYDPDAQANDHGASDWMHGESGNDQLHGMAGSDVLFGGAHDDDVTGGYGNDWISGGTGQDGVLGDDGIIRTSRNGTAESMFGIAATTQTTVSTPGKIQTATIYVTNELAKSMDLTPLSVDSDWLAEDDEFGSDAAQGLLPYADDVVYGGLGTDFLHGGSGDDAISGAEALDFFHLAALVTMPGVTIAAGALDPGLGELDGTALGEDTLTRNGGGTIGADLWINPGNVLRFNSVDVDGWQTQNRERAGEFALYNEYDPLRRIMVNSVDGWSGGLVTSGGYEFLLNFDQTEGVLRASETVASQGNTTIITGTVNDDGADRIFGGTGNDWLVGGTGRDNVYGGWGNDLLNADDNHTTNGSLNDKPDTHSTYEDRAYGGAGRDVLIANTGGDRLIDWVGEFNSYLVPFAPFGMATVSRTLQPQLPEFLYALSRADGADPTVVADGNGTADRNGEPHGELGLVLQKDFAWQDQTGAPADPQAGNIPGGQRDVLRSADFNNAQGQGFVAESGTWSLVNGKYQVAPAAGVNKDAVSLFYVDNYVPSYFEVKATINAVKPTGGLKSNAYVVFDYQSPTNFKFAGINVSTNKYEIGQRTANGWQVLASAPATGSLKVDTDYNVFLSMNGSSVSMLINNVQVLGYAFAPRVDKDGVAYFLNAGMVGLGADNGRARIDNVSVQIVPPQVTWTATDSFAGGVSTLLSGIKGNWSVANGRLTGAPAAGQTLALATNDIRVGANAMLKIESLVNTSGVAGIMYDAYSSTDFKWVAVSKATNQVLFGHFTEQSGWVVDKTVARTIGSGDQALALTLKGSTVSVTLNGTAVASHVYNAPVVDGAVGLLARGGSASFDNFKLSTDDAALANASSNLLTAAVMGTSSKSMPVQDASLEPVVQAAMARWESILGARPAVFDSLRFAIADLEGTALARTEGARITVDRNAAGHGWFVDTTPMDDREFRARDEDGRRATRQSEAFGRMDLLSVVMHEIGHALGYDHAAVIAGHGALMEQDLAAGVRVVDAQHSRDAARIAAAPAADRDIAIRWNTDSAQEDAWAWDTTDARPAAWQESFVTSLGKKQNARQPLGSLRIRL